MLLKRLFSIKTSIIKKWRHRDESLLYNEMRNQLVGLSVVVTKNNLFCEDEHLIGFLSNEKVREVKFMAKRVFFSFYYENDLSRALVVKNNWALKENEESGFISNSEFERMKRDGDEAIERWIDKQIAGTSVTVVLIGSETLDSKYVQYAIKKSYELGNSIIALKIGKIKNLSQQTSISQSVVKIVGKKNNGNYFGLMKSLIKNMTTSKTTAITILRNGLMRSIR